MDEQRSRRSTVALYSDDLRFNIIKEVFKRPQLWDNMSREPPTVLQRKEFFEEISDKLKPFDNTLTASIVEKQWKNLKDTYNKVKKKVYTDENGVLVFPKWRFFNAMNFLDQDAYEPETSLKIIENAVVSSTNLQNGCKPCVSKNDSTMPFKVSSDFSSDLGLKNQKNHNNSINVNYLLNTTNELNFNEKYLYKKANVMSDDEDDSFWGIRYA